MASFDSDAFDIAAFDEDAFDFGAGTPVGGAIISFSSCWIFYGAF